MTFEKHASALITDSDIGQGSSVGPYAVIRNGVVLGRNCVVGDHAVLEGPLEIADDVTIGAHSYLHGPAVVGCGVHFGPHSSLDSSAGHTITIAESAVIGIHAIVLGSAIIGRQAIIEPGSVVSKNVPANAVVGGNPAKIIRYVEAITTSSVFHGENVTSPTLATNIRGVMLYQLPMVEDLRGNLSFGEVRRHVPFDVKRYFLTFDVSTEEARGEHAHKQLHQFLICVHGKVLILADDGTRREEFILDRPNLALHLPPLVWGVQYRFSADAVLLVLCSDLYDPEDYIRDYGEFLRIIRTT